MTTGVSKSLVAPKRPPSLRGRGAQRMDLESKRSLLRRLIHHSRSNSNQSQQSQGSSCPSSSSMRQSHPPLHKDQPQSTDFPQNNPQDVKVSLGDTAKNKARPIDLLLDPTSRDVSSNRQREPQIQHWWSDKCDDDSYTYTRNAPAKLSPHKGDCSIAEPTVTDVSTASSGMFGVEGAALMIKNKADYKSGRSEREEDKYSYYTSNMSHSRGSWDPNTITSSSQSYRPPHDRDANKVSISGPCRETPQKKAPLGKVIGDVPYRDDQRIQSCRIGETPAIARAGMYRNAPDLFGQPNIPGDSVRAAPMINIDYLLGRGESPGRDRLYTNKDGGRVRDGRPHVTNPHIQSNRFESPTPVLPGVDPKAAALYKSLCVKRRTADELAALTSNLLAQQKMEEIEHMQEAASLKGHLSDLQLIFAQCEVAGGGKEWKGETNLKWMKRIGDMEAAGRNVTRPELISYIREAESLVAALREAKKADVDGFDKLKVKIKEEMEEELTLIGELENEIGVVKSPEKNNKRRSRRLPRIW